MAVAAHLVPFGLPCRCGSSHGWDIMGSRRHGINHTGRHMQSTNHIKQQGN